MFGSDQSEYVIGVQMFDASHIFRRIQKAGVRSIIVTSGTLSPMDQLEKELGIEFKHKLQNGHVIDESNMILEVITSTSING